MALLWCDGFDHYGNSTTGRTAMLDGVYAEVDSDALPNSSNPRTGTYALNISATADVGIRRVFGGDKSSVGVGYAIYLNSLPTSSTHIELASFRGNDNVRQCTITLSTTGQVVARTGNASGTVLATSGTVMVASAYQHFECKVTISSTVGAVEVRVNGVTVLNVTNVDTRSSGEATTAQVKIGQSTDAIGGATMVIDDLFAWDTTGSSANDFIGDHRVLTMSPNGDTAQTDWVRSTGSTASNDYEHIDDVAPDDDTTYIAATSTGSISEFDIENLPANISAITAIQVVNHMRKTDAGDCNVQATILSGTNSTAGSDRPITEVYTYWQDVFHTDPATGAAWTTTGFDALKLRVERTA